MSSKRHRRRKSCEGKANHHTQIGAIIEADLIRQRSGITLTTYKCQFGNHWHCGNRMIRYDASLTRKGSTKRL